MGPHEPNNKLEVAPLRVARPSQAKQNYHCMMAGIELENYASGHEMSNQHSAKPDLPQHKPGSPCENWSIPTTLQLHLFKSYTISIWDDSLTKLYATYSKQLSGKMLCVEYSGAEQLNSFQASFSSATQPPRRPHASHMSCRDISMAELSPLSTV